MAGAGVRLFTAGSVLTASQVNTYLMDQTVMRFANASARDSSFDGLGETVLAEGMVCYLDDQNKVFVNIDGTSGGWVEVGFDGDLEVSTKTNNYTIGLNDRNSIIQMNVAGSNTLTIPPNSTVPLSIGSQLVITQLGTGQTTISGDTGVTVYPSTTVQIPRQYSSVTLIKVATNTWYVIGELAGEIVNADISASAAIDKTKISGTAITAADTGTVTSTMIADGTILDADINSAASITHSKLANATPGQVLLGATTTGVMTATTISGDITVTGGGVTAIGSGVIVNADINASAAIAHSKLANITAGSVLLGNASNVPTATAITGDVTVSSTGVTAISSGAIVNADINASAAIDKTKISGTAITAADTGTVTATIIADNAVTQAKLADRVVGSAEYDSLTLNAQTGTTYTLVLADAHKLVTLSNASGITLTVPPNSSVAFETGDQVNLLQLGAGQVTVAAGSGVTLRSEGSKVKLAGQYALATLVKIASDEWVLVGNLTS